METKLILGCKKYSPGFRYHPLNTLSKQILTLMSNGLSRMRGSFSRSDIKLLREIGFEIEIKEINKVSYD